MNGQTIRFGERSHVFRVFCDGLGGITQAFFHLFSHFFPAALADIFKFIIWETHTAGNRPMTQKARFHGGPDCAR